VLTSYHNHTRWSDGTAELDALIDQAAALGLDEIGVSDHWVLDPEGRKHDWSMPVERLPEYVDAVLAAMNGRTKPVVRLGLEVDYFPETIEQTKERIAPYPFDYVVGSVHYVRGFPLDATRDAWASLAPEEVDRIWREYYAYIGNLASSGLCSFVAHFDLPKKFGFRPTSDLKPHALAALDAIAANGLAIEINTAGWNLPASEAYPAPDLLRAARDRDIPLLINADAHSPAHLTRHFDRARQLARDCGYTELVRFERRQRTSYPLE
jgi:histidinol-phosphatase (PHP family)